MTATVPLLIILWGRTPIAIFMFGGGPPLTDVSCAGVAGSLSFPHVFHIGGGIYKGRDII